MKLTAFAVLLLLSSLETGSAQYTCTPIAEAPTCACALNDLKVIDLTGAWLTKMVNLRKSSTCRLYYISSMVRLRV